MASQYQYEKAHGTAVRFKHGRGLVFLKTLLLRRKETVAPEPKALVGIRTPFRMQPFPRREEPDHRTPES